MPDNQERELLAAVNIRTHYDHLIPVFDTAIIYKHRLCADCGLLRDEVGEARLCRLVADLAGELSTDARSERDDDDRSADGDCTSLSWRGKRGRAHR